MPMGPQLSRRQMPYFVMALGALLLAPSVAEFVGEGVPPGLGSRVAIVSLALTSESAIFIGVGLYYAWRHSRIPQGTREYESLDEGRVSHRPNRDQFAFALCIGAVIAGMLVLGLLEGSQGRCYRGAPNDCEFSWNPLDGWEFLGSSLYFGGIVAMGAYVAGRIGVWLWHRHMDPWA